MEQYEQMALLTVALAKQMDPDAATMTALSAAFAGKGTQQITPAMHVYEAKTDLLRNVVIHDSNDDIYAWYNPNTGNSILHKSVDNGATWTVRGTAPGQVGTIAKYATGTLMAFEGTSTTTPGLNPKIWRSTDDGVTWVNVGTLNYPPFPHGGVCGAPDGSILISEYGNVANTVYRVRRSTDDGLTFTTVLSSPGTDPFGDPGHIHSITYDTYAACHIVFMDRPNGSVDGPYIYKSTDNGATWTLVGVAVSNTTPNFVQPMYFENYIAWGTDNEVNGIISRIKRTDFYAGNFVGKREIVAQLNKKSHYYTFPIRDGIWLCAGATESLLSQADPEAPGNYANEVYIVSGDGAIVTGGFSHFQADSTPGTLTARKIWFPTWAFGRTDHRGLSWVNITSGIPRAYAAVPYSQGWELPTQKLGVWGTSSPVLGNLCALYGKRTDNTLAEMLFMNAANQAVFTNSAAPGANRAEIRHDPTGVLSINQNSLTPFTMNNGVLTITNLCVTPNDRRIYWSGDSPEGVVTALVGSLCVVWNAGRGKGLYVKEIGTGNVGWAPVGHPSGSTASRPTMQTPLEHISYYDTTLNRPIWWDGTAWRLGVVAPLVPATNPDTSAATLAALETEVNELKALLRTAGLIAP